MRLPPHAENIRIEPRADGVVVRFDTWLTWGGKGCFRLFSSMEDAQRFVHGEEVVPRIERGKPVTVREDADYPGQFEPWTERRTGGGVIEKGMTVYHFGRPATSWVPKEVCAYLKWPERKVDVPKGTFIINIPAGSWVDFYDDDEVRVDVGQPGVKVWRGKRKSEKIATTILSGVAPDPTSHAMEMANLAHAYAKEVTYVANPGKEGESAPSPLYHVTYLNRIPSIAEHGLVPNAPPTMQGAWLQRYSRGKVFLTEAKGVPWWIYHLEEHAGASTDTPEEGWAPVVLRCWDDRVMSLDPEGTRDARWNNAWFTTEPIRPEWFELWDGFEWVELEDADPDGMQARWMKAAKLESDDTAEWWVMDFGFFCPPDEVLEGAEGNNKASEGGAPSLIKNPLSSQQQLDLIYRSGRLAAMKRLDFQVQAAESLGMWQRSLAQWAILNAFGRGYAEGLADLHRAPLGVIPRCSRPGVRV